jgi:hypothetical protein
MRVLAWCGNDVPERSFGASGNGKEGNVKIVVGGGITTGTDEENTYRASRSKEDA